MMLSHTNHFFGLPTDVAGNSVSFHFKSVSHIDLSAGGRGRGKGFSAEEKE